MKGFRQIFLLLLFSVMHQAYGQCGYGFERTKLANCKMIADTSAILFTAFMEAHQYNSADSIIKQWENACGIKDAVLRAKVALAIAAGGNAESILPPNSLDLLDDYRWRTNTRGNRNWVNDNDDRYIDFLAYGYGIGSEGQRFDSFTRKFFAEILPFQQPYSINYILSEFYGLTTDSLFDRIQDRQHPAGRLTLQYHQRVKYIRNSPQTQWDVSTGAWKPTGGAAHLGIHPELGLHVGIKYGRVNVSVAWEARFLSAKTGYYATRVSSDNSVVYTDKFFGLYFGLDGGYDVLCKGNHEVQGLLGVGFDGFDALNKDKARNLESESAKSYNINFGVAYRYYITNSCYLGLRFKYGIVNYALNGVVGFTGNPVSAAIFMGGLEDGVRQQLRSIKYKWRR